MVGGWQGDSQSPLGEMVSELLWTLGFAEGGGHVLVPECCLSPADMEDSV